MKLSEKWLREWVNPALSHDELMHKLTMAGLAVESCEQLKNNSNLQEDYIITFELTPNRGDCLSVLGIAREISALTNTPLRYPTSFSSLVSVQPKQSEISIHIQSPEDCPRYVGQVIENFSANKSTPDEIQQKLSYAGIKLIHPIVDVMNYVMLETGQPLHAFDLSKINHKEIIIRHAKNNESIILLEGKKVILQADTLVIADKHQVHAVAGIMGGLEAAVTENTQAILIESAFFTPQVIAGRARRYGLHTEASHRFERGVDPELAHKAIRRATGLLSKIYDNLNIFQSMEKSFPEYLPRAPQITLRLPRIEKILGVKLSPDQIQAILLKLDCFVEPRNDGELIVVPPAYRFDIREEIDLIEEVARLYGYEALPIHSEQISRLSKPLFNSESSLTLSEIKRLFIHQDYQEIIAYSFISENAQHQFDPENTPLKLSNPLSAAYAVMRTNLWAGLIETVLYNLNRQQTYMRFFETGLRFVNEKQESVLSGVWAGQAFPEQWGEKNRPVDFFDVKNSLTQLFSLTREEKAFSWKAGAHPALHPAQTAKILKQGECIGLCGALHPQLQQTLSLSIPLFLFEIKLEVLIPQCLPHFQAFSKFPAIRRDIAVVVDKLVEVELLQNSIYKNANHYLIDICVFDRYQGKNLPPGKKSLALGLIFQSMERTLLEAEIQQWVEEIITALKTETGAMLRD